MSAPTTRLDPCKDHTPGKAYDHSLIVLPSAQIVGCDPARVSKGKDHKIEWKSANGERIRIEFSPKPGYPPPFPDMHYPGVGDTCKSGSINKALIPPPEGLHFKYTVTVISMGGKTETNDPGAEIEP